MQRGLGEALSSRVNGAPRAMNTEREEESEGGAKLLGEDLSRPGSSGCQFRLAVGGLRPENPREMQTRRAGSKRMARRRLSRLADILPDAGSVLIVLQDVLDPDAIAAAAALKELTRALSGAACSVAFGGIVARSENRSLIRYLGMSLLPIRRLDLASFDVIAMVDTQPGTGNNSLPASVAPHVVIDHHPMRPATRRVPVHDVRSRYGATSTMLYEYLREARVPLSAPLATALVYGIRSDTQDMGREATRADIDAEAVLYRAANRRMLGRIDMGRLPRSYFRFLDRALRNARTHGGCIVADVGQIHTPDMMGDVADLLLRNEGSVWSMSVGTFGRRCLFSLRTLDRDAHAGRIACLVAGPGGTGGGHSAMAGGQIPLRSGLCAEAAAVKAGAIRRYLRCLGAERQRSRPLIARGV
jgi:nanoRNase/pAp phosphatase (c-di-AMP/oligoRNAs hydrolase)